MTTDVGSRQVPPRTSDGQARVPSEEAAFEAFYERHYPDIVRFLLRRGVGDDAPDLAADTFAVAWRRRSQWLELPAERRIGWLYSVARNVLANAGRAARRSAGLAERLAGRERVRQGRDAADQGAATAERLAIADAFARLSASDQELIRLVAWDGLTPSQAAEVLGCRLGTLTSRLHRARTRLKKHLDSAKGTEQ